MCWQCSHQCDYSADVFREATTDFTVDSRPLTQVGGDHIKAHIANPSGASTECFVTDNADGTYQVEYTPFEKGELTSAWNMTLFRAHWASPWLKLTPASCALPVSAEARAQ